MVREVTPWHRVTPPVQGAKEVDLTKAREVHPLVTYGMLDLVPLVATNLPSALDLRALVVPATESSSAKAVDDDPKVATLSAVDSVSFSEIDSSASGTQAMDQIQIAIHPSTLPANQDDPATAEREATLTLDPLSP